MGKTVSEHVKTQAEERPAAQAVTPRAGRPAAPPAEAAGRPPGEPVHPGIPLAAWVWLVGFAALFLQIVAEGAIILVRLALHR
jgi:hypothetical protein